MKKLIGGALAFLALTVVVIAVPGCGKGTDGVGAMVNGVQIRSYHQEGDLWTSLSAQLSTGSMTLASVNVPVIDPNRPGVVFGQLALIGNLCSPNSVCNGGSTLTISVNITAVAKIPETGNTLPNGTMIPVGQAVNAAVVALPVGNSGGKIYVAMGKGIALLGTALPFSGLNEVGRYVPGVNIFQPFMIDKVAGTVGVFTGSQPNTTGIGLFVDLSSVINQDTPAPAATVMAAGVSSDSQALSAARPVDQVMPITFEEVKPSATRESAVYYRLWRLNNRRTELILH